MGKETKRDNFLSLYPNSYKNVTFFINHALNKLVVCSVRSWDKKVLLDHKEDIILETLKSIYNFKKTSKTVLRVKREELSRLKLNNLQVK